MSKSYTVIAILEAKQGKENKLKTMLESVVAPSRAEGSNLEYRLHQSLDHPGQFILYENWESKEKHQEQFEKPYIKALIEESQDLLAKPYQVIFAKEIYH